MKRVSVILASVFVAYGLNAQTAKWGFDKSHSSVNFTVDHMVIAEVAGSFNKFDGTILSDKADFTDMKIDFTIETASINTANEGRDKHLTSADFFDATAFPAITFKSTSIAKISDKAYKVTGDFTMRGVTKTISLDVTYGGTITDPYKNTRAGFKVTTVIDRTAYGVNWSKTMDAGGLVVGNEVTLTARVEIVKAK